MLPGKRKRIEPMAARVQPDNVRSAHQSTRRRRTRAKTIEMQGVQGTIISLARHDNTAGGDTRDARDGILHTSA